MTPVIVVAFVGLVLYGGRLPEMMRTMGGSYRKLKRSVEDLTRQATTVEPPRPPYKPEPPKSPAALPRPAPLAESAPAAQIDPRSSAASATPQSDDAPPV